MKPEKENLIHDLLDDGSHRRDTLLAGARVLRRRRYWRAARRTAAITALILTTAIWSLKHPGSPSAPSQASKVVSTSLPPSEVRALSDDELLALFPNTPVGLASLANGKKRLIFPRAGDEERFISRF